MLPEHVRKLGRLFVGGAASWDAFTDAAPDSEAKRRALGRIIRDNEPFIKSCVRSLKERGLSSPLTSVVSLDDDDLLQAGRRGYAEAIKHYDPAKGALPGYAKLWIRREVQRCASKDATISQPEQTKIPAASLRAGEAVMARTGRPATAEEMGLTEAKHKAWRSAPTIVSASTYERPQERGAITEGGVSDYADYGTYGGITEDTPETLFESAQVRQAVKDLHPAEHAVIALLFWDRLPLADAARELAVSVATVEAFRDRALQNLRNVLLHDD